MPAVEGQDGLELDRQPAGLIDLAHENLVIGDEPGAEDRSAAVTHRRDEMRGLPVFSLVPRAVRRSVHPPTVAATSAMAASAHRRDPGLAARFQRLMAEVHGPETPAIVGTYDFSNASHIVDVGGGFPSTYPGMEPPPLGAA